MADKVGIVGVVQTKYEAAKSGLHINELVFDVVEEAFKQTGLRFTEEGGKEGIDGIVTCSHDHWDGRVISQDGTTDAVGGHYRDDHKVAGDGAWAVLYGMMRILSGHFDTVMVVAHCKESVTDGRLIENAGIDHIYHRLLGIDFLSGAAMQARRYMHKYGITPEQCAKVAVRDRKNAKNNPYAQEPLEINVEDVLKSDTLASPINTLDAKPVSDGACVLILANEEKTRKFTDKPVWITGAGNCYDSHLLGDRDLADCESLVLAAGDAYKMAGITDPRKAIDVAEISDVYSYQGLLWPEGLGFCDKGIGGRFNDGGIFEMGGELPINPSGGLLSGVPVTVAGASRVIEAALQLRGEAGARQVPGAKAALAHGTGGVCGQMQCVLILEKD